MFNWPLGLISTFGHVFDTFCVALVNYCCSSRRSTECEWGLSGPDTWALSPWYNPLLLKSSPTKPPTQTDTHTLADITRYSSPTEPLQCTAELCSYPHVKLSIRDLNPIFTTAPIFQQSHYFRQNIWLGIWVQFHFQYIFQNDLP